MIYFKNKFINYFQSPLSPIETSQLIGSLIFLFLSITYLVFVILYTSHSHHKVSGWKLQNNLDILNIDAKRINSDNDALARPIFSKSRRPNLKENFGTTDIDNSFSNTQTNMHLVAIMKFNKETKAFIESASSPEGLWVKIGDILDGKTIKKISTTTVILAEGENDLRLSLYNLQGSSSVLNIQPSQAINQQTPKQLRR